MQINCFFIMKEEFPRDICLSYKVRAAFELISLAGGKSMNFLHFTLIIYRHIALKPLKWKCMWQNSHGVGWVYYKPGALYAYT